MQGDAEQGSLSTRPPLYRRLYCFTCLAPIFIKSFTLTFLAEWGDRSQLTTIVLSAREVRMIFQYPYNNFNYAWVEATPFFSCCLAFVVPFMKVHETFEVNCFEDIALTFIVWKFCSCQHVHVYVHLAMSYDSI